MRGYVLRSTQAFSIDEVVYYRMGTQVAKNWFDYHTIPYAWEKENQGYHFPEYFFRPLYKHPPLFTFLIAITMKLFGPHIYSAAGISHIFGVLLILLTYLLGTLVFNRDVGLISAFFIYIDPVTIMTSQKIWPDTTMAFFMVLSVYLFILGLKKSRDIFFIFSGMAVGLAALTKYPGILPGIAILLYAALYEADLFKNRIFRIGYFIIPLSLLAPWFVWNYAVYGLAALTEHAELKVLAGLIQKRSLFLIAVGGTTWLLYLTGRHKKERLLHFFSKQMDPVQTRKKLKGLSYFLIFLFCGLFFREHLFRGFQFDFIPETSWVLGFFSREPMYFYFGRLLEFSLMYGLAYIALFTYEPHDKKETLVLRVTTLVILLFFSFWGSYQSRYILSAIPLLMILGGHFWIKLFNRFYDSQNIYSYIGGCLGLVGFLIFIIFRTLHINAFLSFSNNMCYF